MKFQVTTITIEHGEMTENEIEQMVNEIFDNMRLRYQANIMAHSYKTNKHDHRIN